MFSNIKSVHVFIIDCLADYYILTWKKTHLLLHVLFLKPHCEENEKYFKTQYMKLKEVEKKDMLNIVMT